jgi:hypothetical protein
MGDARSRSTAYAEAAQTGANLWGQLRRHLEQRGFLLPSNARCALSQRAVAPDVDGHGTHTNRCSDGQRTFGSERKTTAATAAADAADTRPAGSPFDHTVEGQKADDHAKSRRCRLKLSRRDPAAAESRCSPTDAQRPLKQPCLQTSPSSAGLPPDEPVTSCPEPEADNPARNRERPETTQYGDRAMFSPPELHGRDTPPPTPRTDEAAAAPDSGASAAKPGVGVAW